MLSGDEAAKIEARKVLGLTSNEEEQAKTEKRKTVGLISQEEEAKKVEERKPTQMMIPMIREK